MIIDTYVKYLKFAILLEQQGPGGSLGTDWSNQ